MMIKGIARKTPPLYPSLLPIPLGRLSQPFDQRSADREPQLLMGRLGGTDPGAGGDLAGLVEVHQQRVVAHLRDCFAHGGHGAHEGHRRWNREYPASHRLADHPAKVGVGRILLTRGEVIALGGRLATLAQGGQSPATLRGQDQQLHQMVVT